MSDARTTALIDELLAKPAETACVEFKASNADAEMIGKRISAMANAARLADEPFAYMLWGVDDASHVAVGSTFDPASQKQGNQPLELWLAQRLQPDVAFAFKTVDYHGTRMVLLEIPAATSCAVEFDRQAYIRIGSGTPKLSDYPDRQRGLWSKLQSHAWEASIAAPFLRGCEKIAHLLRAPSDARAGGALRTNPGHLAHQTPRICPQRTLLRTPDDTLATVFKFFTASER
jgi:ATP-dependent DNA helicase RecG